MPKSVYIHIPFCDNICSYCDFCKMYYHKDWIMKYLDSLEQEINKLYKNEIIDTIYIGGGTPSSLTEAELKKLLSIVNIFKTSNNLEYTIEGNISSMTINKLKLLKRYHVNRLSLGVQSFNQKILKVLNRKENYKQTEKIIKEAKKLGFKNINIDLIYAVPTQTIADLKKDLDYFLQLDINHVSTYSLIIEPNTKLYINKYKNIDEELDLKMYKYIKTKLKNNNYINYEISNYAKVGYESKHNLTYWGNSEYYGFGLGASGYINGIRYNNTKNLTKYLNGDYIYISHKLTKKEQMEEELILGLRKLNGINIKKFEKKYHQSIEETFDIKDLIEQKKILIKRNQLYINPDYMYLSNDILINFLLN